MATTPPIQSPIKTPLPTPVKDAQSATAKEIAFHQKRIKLLTNVKIDTFTRTVDEQLSYANSGVPKDTPQKPKPEKRKRDPIESEPEPQPIESKPEEEDVKKARDEYREKAQKSWEAIIEKKLTCEQDKETFRKALEACASPEHRPHTRKISRKYPTEKSLEDTIKLMHFIQNSQGLSLNPDEKNHFLIRNLQDGTAGFCLKALKEFFGNDPKSSTILVLDSKENRLGLLRKIGTKIEDKSYCLHIPLKWTDQDTLSKNSSATLYPSSIVPMDNEETSRRFRNKRLKTITNNKTKEPVSHHQQLQGINQKHQSIWV